MSQGVKQSHPLRQSPLSSNAYMEVIELLQQRQVFEEPCQAFLRIRASDP
jgi:hypothetical protein